MDSDYMKSLEELEQYLSENPEVKPYDIYLMGRRDGNAALQSWLMERATDSSATETRFMKALNFYSMLRHPTMSMILIWTGIHAISGLNINREELGIIRKKKEKDARRERSIKKAREKAEKLRAKSRWYIVRAESVENSYGITHEKKA